MTTAKYLITDTADERWAIWPGDPAHSLLDALVKTGWEKQQLRLPANVIRGGFVDDLEMDIASLALENATDAYEDWPIEGARDLLIAAFNTYKQLDYLWNLTTPKSASG